MQHTLWRSVLGEVELSMSSASFVTFLKDSELIDINRDEAVVAVKNVFVIRQLEVRYDKIIKEALAHNNYTPAKVTYTIKSSRKRPVISRETTVAPTPTMSQSIAMASSQSPTTLATGKLNPRYTFDSFIVGSSNDLAYAACQAAAQNPGLKYNPIYLYGGVGLGKTHLMQAVGNEILKNQPEARVLYVSTETFVEEFLDSIRFKKKGFASKYRNVDVLIIDDIQFIAGKTATQEGFFHTFNALHQANKQIIISSDKPPKSIPTLTERLRSRFEMGMMIDVQMPDFETRCAILETKASLSGIQLEHDVSEYLANNIKTNIRELEGALNQLLAYAEMRGVTPDIQTAEGLIGNVRHSRPQHVTARQIIEKTAKHFGLTIAEICSERRDKHIVMPRQIAMYLLRSELKLSFPKIAVELGRKDHTTAIHSIEKIERASKLDLLVREQIAEIRDKLYA